MELDLADVALRPTLESGVTMNAERAAKAGIALGLTLEPDEITIRADERKVRQVVFNLLSNAVKFTPPEGRVDVSARLDERRRRGRGVATPAPGSRPRTRS